MKYLLYAFLFIISATSCAQQRVVQESKYPKGENLIDYEGLKTLGTNKKFGQITILDDKGAQDFTLRIETKIKPKFVYQASTALHLNKRDFKKDQVFLLSFEAKTESSSLETGEAKANWILRQSKDHKDNIETTISMSPNWQRYYIPFKATQDISKENLRIVTHFGFREQAFLIRDIKFEAFPKGTDVNELPKTRITYKGMEPNAKWRYEANKRINKIRKSDFSIQFTLNGQPIDNKEVSLSLKWHEFPFGAAMRAEAIERNDAEYQRFKDNFNYVVLENDLKIKAWGWATHKARTLRIIDTLKKDGINIKGHVLIWPGMRYLPTRYEKFKDNPAAIQKLIRNHLYNILDATKGKIYSWDVVNEAYTNNDLQKITGSEKILYEGFRIVHKRQPNALRFVNEYGIISNGGQDTEKQKWYFDFIQRIDKNTGNLLQGIGIQSHIGSNLTPPERVLEILDYYGQLNKKISISEFTVAIQDPDVRQQYTKDFMIAAFSHPKVSEFLFWGCTDNGVNKVDIFKPDGQLGVMGKAYMDLVKNDWTTKVNTKTNSFGQVNFNGFYGTYTYKIKHGDKTYSGEFQVTTNSPKKLNIAVR